MFTILYENQYSKQFCSNYYFVELEDAISHLLSKGYAQQDRTFKLKLQDKTLNAYIQPLKFGRKQIC